MSNSATPSSAAADRNPVTRLVALRWKHALVTFVVGTTTYALYEVGGWTVDTALFGIVTLAIVAYSAATYRSDVR
ncbi:hypothetical protein N0B31_13590 [Salinirubellus salinus]|jgi:hypothetical protein|uniref:Uncharacterized protein n=1 Tax=Salinirubellus salinus TaxID=1364945 RepID=A0A9E7R039_9EURY|nr:hypothetical protein [Salinirubellus salinus]UWM53172.1 hypothetical protein N0B31_13590 [Salinirubellus salinus]